MRLKFALAILVLAGLACSLVSPQFQPHGLSSQDSSMPATESAATPGLLNSPEPLFPGTPPLPTVPAPVVPSPHVTSLHMLNETDGWAITDSAILRTNDGGSTWYNISPRGVTTFGYGTGNTFLSASQAWVMVADVNNPAGSGMLYRTSDGGLNWTSNPVPFGGGDLTFVDPSHGWMLAPLGAGAGSMAVAIYTTADAGVTWTQTYNNDPNAANAGDSLPLSGIKNSLVALDAKTAWVSGVIYAPETFYFYKTSDGGHTWAEQPLPAAPDTQNNDIAIDAGPIFLNTQDAFLPVRFLGETTRTGFYATHDGGASWEFVSFIPGAGAVDFVTPDGLYWNGEGFFITFDGASTWKSIPSDILSTDTFAGMDFVDTRTGWVWTYDQTGMYGLYKTTDGGATWISLEK